MTKSPKGFGYVEFETVDGLKKALDLSGTTLQGRPIRVSIAEPRMCISGGSLRFAQTDKMNSQGT